MRLRSIEADQHADHLGRQVAVRCADRSRTDHNWIREESTAYAGREVVERPARRPSSVVCRLISRARRRSMIVVNDAPKLRRCWRRRRAVGRRMKDPFIVGRSRQSQGVHRSWTTSPSGTRPVWPRRCRGLSTKGPDLVSKNNKWNTVAVSPHGTRCSDWATSARRPASPVMPTGRSAAFSLAGRRGRVPIMLDTKDPDEIDPHRATASAVLRRRQASRHISQPKCFRVLDTLREKAEIPMWHDDQQGRLA